MPLYEKATKEAFDIRDRMIEKYHGPLLDAGVTVDLLFAKAVPDKNGDVDGPALKLHGYACAAVVKVNAYKLRVQGHADAEIVIDGDRWDTWSCEEKDALIDHELEHLELKYGKDGEVVRDDLERPKLRIRLHDHQFGWFDSIARRHGSASTEQQQAKQFVTGAYEQLWLGFAKEPDLDNEHAPAAESESLESFTKEVETALVKAGVPFQKNVTIPMQHAKGVAGKGSKPNKGKRSRRAASSR